MGAETVAVESSTIFLGTVFVKEITEYLSDYFRKQRIT
jgi:dihydroorotate dehydrogenase